MSELSTLLLEWFDLNKRELPFRKNNKPYDVWVSEIMLQQTKVDTVIPYYNAWMKKFPNIESVSEASEEIKDMIQSVSKISQDEKEKKKWGEK